MFGIIIGMRAFTSLAVLVVALPFAAGSASGAAGMLDPSFGSSGVVTTALGTSAAAEGLVLQSDGKIVAVGGAGMQSGGSYSDDFALARYNPDGSLDGSFGSGGLVQAPTGTALAAALQPDGKIVAGGTLYFNQFRVARYNTDGTLDAGFGSGGVVTTQVGTSGDDFAALLLQPDGKLVAGGASSNGGHTVFTVVRYNADGSLDTSFGSGGVVTTPVGVGDSSILGLALEADGKIVAAGNAFNGSAVVRALARYTANGSLDSTFGSGGLVTTPLVGGQGVGGGPIELQPDGKIVSVGTTWNGTRNEFAVARYAPDGSLDASFGSGGVVVTPIGTSSADATGVALQPNGKILVAGDSRSGLPILLTLARYNPDGSLDSGFGSDGIAAVTAQTGGTGNPPPGPPIWAIALQPDGKIVAAGASSQDGGDIEQFMLARFASNALTVTKSGDGGGTVTSNPAGIDCGSTCSRDFNDGASVTLTASASSRSRFMGWTGDCSGRGTCVLTMSGDHSVTAQFQRLCIVPRLKGKTLPAARRSIGRAHCRLGRVIRVTSRVKAGRVVAQRPRPGRRVREHSRVRLEISKD